MKVQSRRHFLKTAAAGGMGLLALPTLLPARLFGAEAPGKKIQIAQIGCGRMGRSDLGNVMTEPLARVVAVCDLDSRRLAAGRKFVEGFYAEQGESSVRVKTYHDYREVLASPEIDAVACLVLDARFEKTMEIFNDEVFKTQFEQLVTSLRNDAQLAKAQAYFLLRAPGIPLGHSDLLVLFCLGRRDNGSWVSRLDPLVLRAIITA